MLIDGDSVVEVAEKRNANSKLIFDQGNIEHAAKANAFSAFFERLELGVCARVVVMHRSRGDDIDGPAGRVAPRECALGAAHDIDPFDVEEVDEPRGLPGREDVVDVYREARIDAGADNLAPDTPERNLRETASRKEIGDVVLQIVEVLESLIENIAARK